MRDHTKFYINGAWVDPLSTDSMPVMNPATGARLGTVALGNAAGTSPRRRAGRHVYACDALRVNERPRRGWVARAGRA